MSDLIATPVTAGLRRTELQTLPPSAPELLMTSLAGMQRLVGQLDQAFDSGQLSRPLFESISDLSTYFSYLGRTPAMPEAVGQTCSCLGLDLANLYVGLRAHQSAEDIGAEVTPSLESLADEFKILAQTEECPPAGRTLSAAIARALMRIVTDSPQASA